MANARPYRYTGRLGYAEDDHLVPLELRAGPNDALNLRVEPPSPCHKANSGFHNPKDRVENEAWALGYSHKVALVVVQRAIAVNWTTALAAVGHPEGR